MISKYKPIEDQIAYWMDYDGERGDDYRKTHDLDCILTGGELRADTIFSLWMPLRFTLNYFDTERWINWKKYLYENRIRNFKQHKEFLKDLSLMIHKFLPYEQPVTNYLIRLFELGRTRANVMILNHREWNVERGGALYYDYMAHFLFDKLSTEPKNEMIEWIKREHLAPFFVGGIIDKEHLKDLANTGSVFAHNPTEIDVEALLKNYVAILEERAKLMKIEA